MCKGTQTAELLAAWSTRAPLVVKLLPWSGEQYESTQRVTVGKQSRVNPARVASRGPAKMPETEESTFYEVRANDKKVSRYQRAKLAASKAAAAAKSKAAAGATASALARSSRAPAS